jgi:hypothetical protein
MSQNDSGENLVFAGWHRLGTGHRWRRLCVGDSEAEAWTLLNALVSGGDKYVGQGDPNRHRQRRDARDCDRLRTEGHTR